VSPPAGRARISRKSQLACGSAESHDFESLMPSSRERATSGLDQRHGAIHVPFLPSIQDRKAGRFVLGIRMYSVMAGTSAVFQVSVANSVVAFVSMGHESSEG